MSAPTGYSIRLAELVACADCRVAFRGKETACPGCGAVIGIYPVETDAPAKEIGRLRDREAWITAALIQIANGYQSKEFKAGAARKALAFLAEGNPKTVAAPAGTDAADEGRAN